MNQQTMTPSRSRMRITILGIACVAFGLLIWSRLLLVTNYPKTAIAEPQNTARTATATANAPE
jgi:hypothetical protein